MSGDPGRADRAAAALAAALAARRPLAPLEPALAPADPAEAYAVQAALARRVGAFPPAGFKVGATAATMQLHLGIRSPAAGFIRRADLLTSGTATPFRAWLTPGVECEIAFRLGADLPPGEHPPERLAAAVAAVLPAIEMVENRYQGGVAIGTPMLIADRFFHAAAVLGAAAPGWTAERIAGRDLARLRGRMTVNGALFGEGQGGDLLGHPLAVLRWLAASPAAAAFGGLRAGQVVLCGSVTPPAWLAGPAEIEVAFEDLGRVALSVTP